MSYSSAWFDGDLARPLAEAQHAKMRRALEEAGVAERLARARDRLRMGRPGGGRRARLRCARHRGHAVARTTRLGPAASGRLRPRRALRPAPAGLPRPRCRARGQALRRHCLDRDVRGRRPRILGRLLRHAAALSRSRVAAPASRASRSATTCSSATCDRPTSSSSTSSPAACCPASRNSKRRRAVSVSRVERTPGLRPRLRRDAAPLARGLPAARARGARTRVRCPLHADLAVLPGLLRSGLHAAATPTSCSSRCGATECAAP